MAYGGMGFSPQQSGQMTTQGPDGVEFQGPSGFSPLMADMVSAQINNKGAYSFSSSAPMQPDPIRQMPMSPQATMQSQMPQNFQWSPYLFAQPQPTPSAPPPPPPPPPPPVATSLFGMTPIAQAQAPAPATPPPAPFTPTISTSPDNMPLFMTPQTPPSGFRPSGMAPQFFQPVYRPRYMNYAYPGTSMGISSFGNPFLGGFGFGYRGAPRYAYAEGGIAHLLKK